MVDSAVQEAISECRQIAKGLYLEGLAVDRSRNLIWCSDVIAGGVRGYRTDGSVAFTLNPERMWTGGVMMNHDGAVLSSGPGGIMWNHPEKGTSGWLVNSADGTPLVGVNEMVSDGHGGIYFGTVDVEQIEKGEPTRPASLYHLSVERELRLVAGPLGFANGIIRSPDGKHLFYNDTFDGTYVFEIRENCSLSERRKLLDKYDCDGMALDADGNILITGFQTGTIVRLAPDGSVIAPLESPAAAITQIRFGGSDLCDVYLNCVPQDAGEGLKAGESPDEERSFLLHGRVRKPGCAMEPARFDVG